MTSPDEQRLLDGSAKESLYAFAYSMLQADKLDVAIKAFRVFVRCAPVDERAWLGLGACHEKLEEHDIAMELYGAGASIASPPSARCHVAMARLSVDIASAHEHLERALEIAESRDDDELLAFVVDASEAW